MLVLASASPRRRDILTAAGISFRIEAPQIDEVRRPGEEPLDFVRRLAQEKAQAISHTADEITLAADTVVCVEEDVLGKPLDEEDARRMLRLLSGRSHWVYTGICLRAPGKTIVDSAATEVWFEHLSEEEITEYVSSGEPMDKAGAYAIQGLASKYISKVHGCYQNVVGLPISLIYRHLKQL